MWVGVELRDVRTFLTLAEELHYGRTAQRLGITPSRVSQTIRLLEGRVGGRLFDRTSRRVRLTALGEQLRSGFGPAYEQMHSAFVGAHEVATGVAGTLRLGMYAPISGGPHLVEIVKTFQTRHPTCRVQLIETGFTREQLDWLRKGDIDLLAMRLPFDHPDIVIGPILSREPRVLLVATDDALAKRQSISYDDVAGYTMADMPTLPHEMLDALIPPVTPSGHRIRRTIVHSPTEAIMRVAAGEIVHPTVPSILEHFPEPAVAAVPIRDLPPSETALVWLRSNPSVRITAFARAATDVLQSHERSGRPTRAGTASRRAS